jgi:aspartate racemase
MKTIGLIGGMSWESSIEYYRIINRVTHERLGGLNSARSIMISVNFSEIEPLMGRGDWDPIARQLIEAARSLQRIGADVLVICTNTMHKLAEQIEGQIAIPLLHIADATGRVLQTAEMKTVALLGTRFTMEEAFYRDRLQKGFGLEVRIPDREDIAVVDDVIFKELCRGKIRDDSRKRYVEIIDRLADAGAEGVVLGCTEIGLLVDQKDSRIPLFDTTRIHAEAAVDFALGGSGYGGK